MWLGRFLLRVLTGVFIVGALACIGVWGVHRYVASREVADHVSQRLGDALGIRVRVGRVGIGVKSGSLDDLELFEPGAGPSAKPWAVIKHADIDVSGLSLLGGRDVPRHVTLRGATVTFCLDRQGQALTQLPKPESLIRSLPRPTASEGNEGLLPELHIRQARLVLQQHGRPDMVITGIDADVRSGGGRLVLSGTVHDPTWGDWAMAGSMDRDGEAGTASLATERPVHIDQAMVHSVRFVSPRVWREVQVTGELPAALEFRFNLPKHEIHYHAVLEPEAVTVNLPCVGLRVSHVRGRVVADDGDVRVEDAQGTAAGGRIEAHGGVHVTENSARVQMAVEVRGVEVARLPRAWDLPPELSGGLTGRADLEARYADGTGQFDGQGTGVVSDARFAEIPTDTLHLRLYADEDGFHFAWVHAVGGGR